MAVSNGLLIVRGVTRIINQLVITMSDLALKVQGLLKVDSLKFGTQNVGSGSRAVYLSDGVPTECTALASSETYSYTGSRPNRNGIYSKMTPSGTMHEIYIVDGFHLYTPTSSGQTGGLTLSSDYDGSYENVYLNNKNWKRYINISKTVTLNDGIVTFKYNGNTIDSCTMNQEDNKSFTIPDEVAVKTVNDSCVSQFRTQTRGSSGSGDYLSIFSNSMGFKYIPKNAPSLAWGRGDTHSYFCVDSANKNAFLGGGNANTLLWYGQIAFKDDIPDSSAIMKVDGSNAESSAFNNLLFREGYLNTVKTKPYGRHDGGCVYFVNDNFTIVLRKTDGTCYDVPFANINEYISKKRLVYINIPVYYTPTKQSSIVYVFNRSERPVFIYDESTTPTITLASNKTDLNTTNTNYELKYPYEISLKGVKKADAITCSLIFDKFVVYTSNGSTAVANTQLNNYQISIPSTISTGDQFVCKITINPRTSTAAAAINNITTTVTKI